MHEDSTESTSGNRTIRIHHFGAPNQALFIFVVAQVVIRWTFCSIQILIFLVCVSPFDCRQVEYLLKWRNYTDSDNTWEPVEHLECPEMIKAFEDERKKREKEDERRNRDEKDVS